MNILKHLLASMQTGIQLVKKNLDGGSFQNIASVLHHNSFDMKLT